MEAAPRLQMLCFEQKTSPKASDFSSPLKKFILSFYGEDPGTYSKAIHELEKLRMAACKATKDYQGIAMLKRYYSQLRLLQNRFPMTDDGNACVAFMWSDIYSGVVFNIADVKYELSSVLYNIGALHSQLGALEDRTSAEGMKNACTHFQCAAWVFHHNRDVYPQPKGCDLSHDLMSFYSLIMLAQSQECILEKSMLDNRKSAISAKIASQIVDFYVKSINNLTSDVKSIVGTKIFQQWKRICEMKVSYYKALTALHMGINAEEENQYGMRVAWYTLAMTRFEESLTAAEEIGIDDTLAFTRDVIGGKLHAAVKENDFVYHDKVPEAESLPEVKGAVLVKGVPFDPNDPEVCGPDLFSNLIPMGAHEASSVYSEQKAQVLRNITKVIEEKDSELAAYESSLNIDKDELREILVKPTLPADIIQMSALFNTKKTAISDLNAQLARLSQISNDIEDLLKEADQLIANSKPTGVTSNVVSDLKAECNKYREIHSHSTKSNLTLRKALEAHDENLALLQYTPDVLQQKLPHVIDATIEDRQAITELIRLLDKVDEMKLQRQGLVTDLRESMINDDITKLIVANAQEDLNAVFDQALCKHKQKIAIIEKNIIAQHNILKAVTVSNAGAAEVRLNLEQARKPWTAAIENLRASCKAFEEVEAQTQKGLDFFEKFHGNVNKLVTRLKSIAQVERDQEERMQARLATAGGSRFRSTSPASGTRSFTPTNFSSTPAPMNRPDQPPKLKDYLAMMKESKNNDYVPSPTPASPSSTHMWHRPSSAMTPMGAPTVVNAYGTQMTCYPPQAETTNIPTHSSVSQAIRPSGQNGVTQQLPHQTTTTVAETFTSQQQSQLFSGYDAKNLTYSHNNYAPYSHLYAGNSVPVSTSTAPPAVHPTTLAYQYSNPYIYSGYVTTAPATPVTTKIATSHNGAQGNQPDTSRPNDLQKIPSNSATAYQWNGYNLPQASPTASATYVISGAYNGVGSGSTSTSFSGSPYTQYYQQYAQQYSSASTPYYGVPSVSPSVKQQTTNSLNPSSNTQSNNGSQPSFQQQPSTGFVSQPNSQVFSTTVTQSGISPSPYQAYPSTVPTNAAYMNTQTITSASSQNGVQAYNSVNNPNVSRQPQNNLPQPSLQQQPQNNLYQSNGSYTYPTNPYQESTTQPNPTNVYPAAYPGYPSNYMSTYGQTGTQQQPQQQPQLQQQPQQQPQNLQPQPQQQLQQQPQQQLPQQQPQVASKPSIPANNLLDESPVLPVPSNILQPTVVASVEESKVELLSDVQKNPVLEIAPPQHLATQAEPKTVTETRSEVQESSSRVAVPEQDTENSHSAGDPFEDQFKVQSFKNSFEQLDDATRNLQLEVFWKEYLDLQESEARNLKISVGRICSMKNRFPDIMPYDYNRVILSSAKDDYINASCIRSEQVGEPNFILTQAPIATSLDDFWTMIWEQDVENVLCLSSFQELSSQLYFPSEKGTSQEYGRFKVTVQSFTEKENGLFSERLLSISGPQGPSKNLILLHLNDWTKEASSLCSFAEKVLYYYESQKHKESPVVIQCLGGCGRSGVMTFCLKWLRLIRQARLPPVMNLIRELLHGRKLILLERDQLKACLDFAHFTAKRHLIQKGHLEDIMTQNSEIEQIDQKQKQGKPLTVEEKLIQDLMEGFQLKTKITKESFEKPRGLEPDVNPADPFSQLDPLWSLKK